MTLTVAIPDDIAAELGDSEQAVSARVRTDLAVHYYEARLVSLGQGLRMENTLHYKLYK